jgi:hypothetical protein
MGLAGTLVLQAAISFTLYLAIVSIILGGTNTTIPFVLPGVILGLPGRHHGKGVSSVLTVQHSSKPRAFDCKIPADPVPLALPSTGAIAPVLANYRLHLTWLAGEPLRGFPAL